MRISQLAEHSGVPATTLRFYESAGLLEAERTPAGHRLYGPQAVERLALIVAAKHLGLPLAEIADLLAVWETGTCADVQADLRPRIAARLQDAERRIAELSGFTSALTGALEHMDALPDRPTPCDPQCGFLDTRQPAARPAAVDLLPGRRAAGAQRWQSAAVACSLTADGAGERAGHWRELVAGARRSEIDHGLRLTLPAGQAAAVAGLAAAEQECCPFFDFRLHLQGRDLHLEVRAPAEGQALLADLFGPTL